MIHSHKLTNKNKKHKSFLEEERNDPITGDKIIEGNEIVLCGACKSAFLLDSWNYMARSHCNQPFTLKEIPTKQHVMKGIEVEVEKEYKFKIDADDTTTLRMLFTSFFAYIIASYFVKMGGFVATLLLFISMSPILYSTISNKKIRINSLKLVISSLLNSSTFYLSKIEKLDFFDSSTDGTVSVIMFLMNGKIKRFKIIKNKHTISEINKLQKYFEENNLQDKISFYQ